MFVAFRVRSASIPFHTYYVKGGRPFAVVKRRIFVDKFSQPECLFAFRVRCVTIYYMSSLKRLAPISPRTKIMSSITPALVGSNTPAGLCEIVWIMVTLSRRNLSHVIGGACDEEGDCVFRLEMGVQKRHDRPSSCSVLHDRFTMMACLGAQTKTAKRQPRQPGMHERAGCPTQTRTQ